MDLALDQITESFADVENLINDLAWRFVRKYGGEFEEVQAQARLIYCWAFKHYKPDKSRLTTWVHIKVWNGLKTYARRHATKHGRTFPADFDLGLVPKKERSFDLRELLFEVSEDAALILNVLFERNQKGELPKNHMHAQQVLRKAMLDEGWMPGRIDKCFREIRRALA